MQIFLIVIVLLVIVVLVLASMKPATFRVERSIAINAPSEKIFPFIDDFHRWPEWSPYEKLDPSMKRTTSGAARGRGAVYEWSGNNKAGTGRMEIVESQPPSKVAIKLDFLKPFEAHNLAEFTMLPQAGTTNVTWAMHGPALFMSKLMQVFINLDKLVGKDFEVGLANLKARAEA